ncbi:MAG: DUF4922 domain-containing protein [Candidatus Doudnabacteria bacterium]|nr:DUF4922 domain-containing protein [Candidatus Doudnabacteria bacterium]
MKSISLDPELTGVAWANSGSAEHRSGGDYGKLVLVSLTDGIDIASYGWMDDAIDTLREQQLGVDGFDYLKESIQNIREADDTTKDEAGREFTVLLRSGRKDRTKPYWVDPGTDCILDADQLCAKQRGLLFAGMFTAINPFLIIKSGHLNSVDQLHRPQDFAMVPKAIAKARALGSSWMVLQNGGEVAGATVPRHGHVQAVKLPETPVERELRGSGLAFECDDKMRLLLPKDLGRTVIVATAGDHEALLAKLRKGHNVLMSKALSRGVPYGYNFAVRADEDGYTAFYAPRIKRIPSLYAALGLTNGPATLEALGIWAASQDEQFDAFTGPGTPLHDMYDEIIMPHHTAKEALGELALAA